MVQDTGALDGCALGEQAEEFIASALDWCRPVDVPNRARQAVEAIFRYVYGAKVGSVTNGIPLDTLIRHKEIQRAVPSQIRHVADELRATGNEGSHPGHRLPSEWTREDARSLRNKLRRIVDWYYDGILEAEPPDHIRHLLDRDDRAKRTLDERMAADDRRTSPRYRLQRALGEGGAAVVYEAFDTVIQSRCALKILKEELLEDEAWIQRFKREARHAIALKHRHIATVHDIKDLPDQRPYLVMGLAEGGSLATRLQAGPVDVERACRWTEQLLEALVHIHARGFVHRDVKPGNVLLDETDNVLLADFGISLALDSSETRVTLAGEQPGTRGYMPPEYQLRGDVSSKTDVYGAALVLQEALSGSPTPPGKNVPPPLDQLIRKMADPDPDERPTAAVAAATLRDYRRDHLTTGPLNADETAFLESIERRVLSVGDELQLDQLLRRLRRVPGDAAHAARLAAARATLVQLAHETDALGVERLETALRDIDEALSTRDEVVAWHDLRTALAEALRAKGVASEELRRATLASRRRATELEPDSGDRLRRILFSELGEDPVSASMFAIVAAIRHTLVGDDWVLLSDADPSPEWRMLCAYLDDFAAGRAPAAARQVEALDLEALPTVCSALALAYMGTKGSRRHLFAKRALERAASLPTVAAWPWWDSLVGAELARLGAELAAG